MEALSSSTGVSPHDSILFAEMFDQNHGVDFVNQSTLLIQANLEAKQDRLGVPHQSPPLSSTQAFAKGRSRATASPPFAKRRSPRQPKVSVLVVDDVSDVTEMIGLFLKHAGYKVETAESASEALELAHDRIFDLVISDIGMPEMNGYELAEKLRAFSNYEGTPMIAVTGYSEYDDRQRSLQAGFNAHLTKPIDPSQLLELMNELLG